MNPSFNHAMHLWTRSLLKVKKINMGRYGISAFATLRGVVIDWISSGPVSDIGILKPMFSFGAMMDELCPLFEEVCAILGCDPDSPLVRHEPQVGYVGSFE